MPTLRRPLRTTALTTTLLLATALSACDRDQAAGKDQDTAQAPLPSPRQTGGAITDMPDNPGPGEVPLAGKAPPPPPADPLPGDAQFGMPPLEDNPETGLAVPATTDPSIDAPASTPAAEPTPLDAVTLIRQYYAAISARDYPRAYAAWSDGGRASGMTPEQFAAGFADTTAVEFTVGDPGSTGSAAGSRYVEVPVTVTATHADGSTRHYAGRYTLRRAVVDGATPDQRAWRIASADLREAAQ